MSCICHLTFYMSCDAKNFRQLTKYSQHQSNDNSNISKTLISRIDNWSRLNGLQGREREREGGREGGRERERRGREGEREGGGREREREIISYTDTNKVYYLLNQVLS